MDEFFRMGNLCSNMNLMYFVAYAVNSDNAFVPPALKSTV